MIECILISLNDCGIFFVITFCWLVSQGQVCLNHFELNGLKASCFKETSLSVKQLATDRAFVMD